MFIVLAIIEITQTIVKYIIFKPRKLNYTHKKYARSSRLIFSAAIPSYTVDGQVQRARHPGVQVNSTQASGTSNVANPPAYSHYSMEPPSYEQCISKHPQSSNSGTQHIRQYDCPAQGGLDTFSKPPPYTYS